MAPLCSPLDALSRAKRLAVFTWSPRAAPSFTGQATRTSTTSSLSTGGRASRGGCDRVLALLAPPPPLEPVLWELGW